VLSSINFGPVSLPRHEHLWRLHPSLLAKSRRPSKASLSAEALIKFQEENPKVHTISPEVVERLQFMEGVGERVQSLGGHDDSLSTEKTLN
jgi:hypothetical protein